MAMGSVDGFLSALELVRPLVASPEVTTAWDLPSALDDLTVGALTAHLVHAVASVDSQLDKPVPDAPPVDTVTYYLPSAGPDASSPSVREAVNARNADQAQSGSAAVLAKFDTGVECLRTRLPAEHPSRLVRVPIGRCMRLDNYLVTRLIEVVVHADDLAVSVDVPPPAFTADSCDPIFPVFGCMCRSRHGDAAVIRGFARRERDAVDALRSF